MRPAKRMDIVPESGTLKVLTLAKELERKGKDIIHLEVGQPDFDTPEHIKRAAEKALAEGATGYAPSQGIPELREEISKNLKAKNIKMGSDEIIVTPGAKHALFSAMVATLDPGAEIIIPSPCWTYEGMARIAGAEPVFVECLQEEGFKVKPDDVEDKISSKTRMLLLNYPNNPTGAILEGNELHAFADLAMDNRLWILTDEIYDAMTYEKSSESIASFSEVKDRTIYINGFSKTYAMTGWRLGYAGAPAELISEMVKIQQNSTTCAASFTQIAGVAALKGPQNCVQEMIQEYEKRRKVIVEGLSSIDGIKCLEPEGTFYVFPKVEELGKSSIEFCEYLLQEAGVATVPGSAFGPSGEGYIRVSFANSEENIRRAIDRIEKVA